MELTTKGYLVLFVFLPVVAVIALLDRRKDQKHRSAIEDTGRSGGGVIRTSSMLRGVLVFIPLVFWGMVLLFSWLAYQDGAFEDPSVLGPFGAVLGILLILTLIIVVAMGSVWQEIGEMTESCDTSTIYPRFLGLVLSKLILVLCSSL